MTLQSNWKWIACYVSAQNKQLTLLKLSVKDSSYVLHLKSVGIPSVGPYIKKASAAYCVQVPRTRVLKPAVCPAGYAGLATCEDINATCICFLLDDSHNNITARSGVNRSSPHNAEFTC